MIHKAQVTMMTTTTTTYTTMSRLVFLFSQWRWFFKLRLWIFLVYLSVCLLVFLGTSPPAHSAKKATLEQMGLEIAQKSRAMDRGFGNFTVNQTMVLRNKRGQKSQRQLRVKILEVARDGNKSMFVFDYPKDVKGTALLIYAHKVKDDEQWLYLPALKRIKRISSSNRSGSFMGSEFAYEDLSIPEVEKFTYRYLRDEPCGEKKLNCSVSERVPTGKGSGYSRQVVWRDRDALRVWKIHYYDRKNSHLKTLTFKNYKKYLDRYWRTHRMEMVNHLTGKETLLTWKDFNFRTKLNDRDFSRAGLKRAR